MTAPKEIEDFYIRYFTTTSKDREEFVREYWRSLTDAQTGLKRKAR